VLAGSIARICAAKNTTLCVAGIRGLSSDAMSFMRI
jgi:hypothetical protein